MCHQQFLQRMLLLLLANLAACTLLAQDITVSGKVTAASGEALQGVSVAVKNTKTTTTTDATGTFTIKGVNANYCCAFRFSKCFQQQFNVTPKEYADGFVKKGKENELTGQDDFEV